jgi:TonB family protein
MVATPTPLTEDAADQKTLKIASLGALVFHFILFVAVFPSAKVEPIPLSEQMMAATVIKRYEPPAPPARPKKATKKNTNPIPIPDPTPNDPEPMLSEESKIESDDPEAEFDVGLPNAPPGASGARIGAVSMGSGDLIPPVQLTTVLPEYTPSATRDGIQGDVYIEAVVTVDGTVADPRLIHGLLDDELNQRALDAILKWTFKPGLKNGKPVPVIAMFTVTFRIH